MKSNKCGKFCITVQNEIKGVLNRTFEDFQSLESQDNTPASCQLS